MQALWGVLRKRRSSPISTGRHDPSTGRDPTRRGLARPARSRTGHVHHPLLLLQHGHAPMPHLRGPTPGLSRVRAGRPALSGVAPCVRALHGQVQRRHEEPPLSPGSPDGRTDGNPTNLRRPASSGGTLTEKQHGTQGIRLPVLRPFGMCRDSWRHTHSNRSRRSVRRFQTQHVVWSRALDQTRCDRGI